MAGSPRFSEPAVQASVGQGVADIIDLTDHTADGGPGSSYDAAELRRLMVRTVDMRPSWRHTVPRLLLVAAGLAAGWVLISTGHPIATVAGVAVVALMFASMVSAQHECAHRALFAHRWLNDGLGLFIGVVLVVPYGGYRRFHLHHHAHTHEIDDSEPVVVAHSTWMWAGSLVGAAHAMRWMATRWTIGLLRGGNNRQSRQLGWLSIGGLLLTLALAAIAVLSVPKVFLIAWLAPVLLGAVISGFLILPEHYGCAYGPDDVVRTTRTVRSNSLGRFLQWNANYHAEHHWAPTVPTCRLPQVHRLLGPYLEHVESGYFRYHAGVAHDLWQKRYAAEAPWDADDVVASSPR
jgi:fatty acid desaturase